MLRLGGGDGWLLQKKKKHKKKRRNERRGEKGRSPSHKLNINDEIIDIIIPSITSLVILLVKILRYRMIYLFKSHYDTFHYFFGIIFLSIFTNK